MRRASVPRNCSLSSTMEMVIGISSLRALDGWHCQTHDGPAFGRRLDLKLSSDILHSRAHVAQPISGGFAGHACRTTSVVLNLQRKVICSHPQTNQHFGSARVANDIRNGFLGGEK